MRSNVVNLWRKIYPEKVDQFDRLPDEIILSIFKRIGDATALGRCCAVSRRFHSIVPQVDDIVIHVGSITLEEKERELDSSPPRHPIASFFRILFSGIFNPLLSLAQLIIPSARLVPLLKEEEDDDDDEDDEDDDETVSLRSMSQILKNFNEIKRLWIELSAGEVTINDGVLLKLKAEYSSTLESCVILAASSVANRSCSCDGGDDDDDDGADLDSLHESFYSDEGLGQRVVWIANSLIATSTRHYLLHPLIAEHKTLETLVLTDADGQGLLTMDKEQLEELRAMPFTTVPSSSTRIVIPSLEVQLWYSPRLEMPDGVVLKGATLIAIRPREGAKPVGPLLSWAEPEQEGNWIVSAFEGPYGAAARMLVKERRIYGLDINAF